MPHRFPHTALIPRYAFSALFLFAVAFAHETAEGLVAWWCFEEGAGNTIVDQSGHGWDGILHGNGAWTQGRAGKALRLDGSTVVDLGSPPAFRMEKAFTLEAWILPDEWIPGTFHGVAAKMPDAAPYAGWALYHAGYNDMFQVAANLSGVDTRLATAPPHEGRWHHVAVSFDGETLRLYVDGESAGTRKQKGALAVNDEPLLLGRLYKNRPETGFKGLIDEVRLWNRALTGEELAARTGVAVKASPARPTVRVSDYPASLYASNFPAPSGAPMEACARSVTWGRWNWTPSTNIAISFEGEAAEKKAARYAELGVNLVFIDEYRYILVDPEPFQTYLRDLKKVVDICHRHGLKVALHLTVTGVLSNHGAAHPEQAAYDIQAKGGAYFERYGTWNMCPNNPGFRRDFLARVEALMRLGFDGLMPDETSWLPGKASLCGCEHCRKRFKTQSGFEVPDPADKAVWENWEAPRWRAWMDFHVRSQGDMLVAIREVAERFGDKVLTACQCNYLQAARNVGNCIEDMRRGITASFYECEPGNPWSWRYNLAEARAYTAYGPSFFLEYSGSLSQQYFSWAFALTCGLRVWTWPELMRLPTFPFRWEKKWETLFTTPTPFADTAILYSAPAVKLLPAASVTATAQEYVGWAEALTEAHVPFETLAASRLAPEMLARFKLLLLPAATCLSVSEAEKIAAFVKNGGTLILTGESSLYDETGARRRNFALAELLGVDWVETKVAARLTFNERDGGGKKLRYTGRQAVVKAEVGTAIVIAAEDGSLILSARDAGRGKALYLSIHPGSRYFMPKVSNPGGDTWGHRLGIGGTWSDRRQSGFKQLMLSVVEPGGRPFTAKAPTELILQPYRHAWRDYRGILVHCLNALGTRFEETVRIPPWVNYEFLNYPDTGKITFSIETSEVRKAYYLSPDFVPVVRVPFTQAQGRCQVELPSVGRYGVLYLVQGKKDAVQDGLLGTPLVDGMPPVTPFPMEALPDKGK